VRPPHLQKWFGGVAQVAECLHSKCKALSSNSSSTQKTKTKHKKNLKTSYSPYKHDKKKKDQSSVLHSQDKFSIRRKTTQTYNICFIASEEEENNKLSLVFSLFHKQTFMQ
jgi:hypothetical protein